MNTRILVLGDGTGGIVFANSLMRNARKARVPLHITVIGDSPVHTYQPGYLFLPFQMPGYREPRDLQRDTKRLLLPGIEYVSDTVTEIDPDAKTVATRASGSHRYDFMVASLGSRIVPDSIEGLAEHLTEGGRAHTFYTTDGAMRLARALEGFGGGRLVINIAEMPIKCPVAPIEFACLADAYLTRRGIRKKTEIVLVTPLSGAFTKPVCNAVLTGMLTEEKGIEVVPDFALESVTDTAIRCFDGNEVAYDLLVSIPPHEGSDLLYDAGLGDVTGFGFTDKKTLKSSKADRVYFIGDCSNVPISKAGSVAHFQAEVVRENILREINHQEPLPAADGHANCFIETGHRKAILIDFNYDTQPVRGRFPPLQIGIAGHAVNLGPMKLLEESYVNHWGKLAFKWVYWNMLLPGRAIPFVDSQMSKKGKDFTVLDEAA